MMQQKAQEMARLRRLARGEDPNAAGAYRPKVCACARARRSIGCAELDCACRMAVRIP